MILYRIGILAIILIFSSVDSSSQSFNQIKKLVASDRSHGDALGYSVSLSGNYAIVGSYLNDKDENGQNSISSAGAAYIWEMDQNGSWSQVQKLIASDRESNDYFGCSVSIFGQHAIVGAYGKDSSGIYDYGCAYIFERESNGLWMQKQKIVPLNPSPGSNFGKCVAISDHYALIGAPAEKYDTSGANPLDFAGAAYLFKKDSITGDWYEVKKITPNIRDVNCLFGSSVCLSDSFAFVGATGDKRDEFGNDFYTGAGGVYIFKADLSESWQQVKKLVAPIRKASDLFGTSISVSSSVVVIGAPYEDDDINDANPINQAGSAYVAELNSQGQWSITQKIVSSDRNADDMFGYAVSTSDNRIVVAALRDGQNSLGGGVMQSSGSAYIFEKNGGVWGQVQKIVASDRQNAASFGNSVSVSGNTILVGAMAEPKDENGGNALGSAGAAYLFLLSNLSVEENKGTLARLYPNPSYDFLNIEMLDTKKAYSLAVITDALDRVVLSVPVVDIQKIVIPLGTINAGIYYVYLLSESQKFFAGKIIKH